MPIRPELRKFYRGAAWEETRERILERAKYSAPEQFEWLQAADVARCEQCGKPDRFSVYTVTISRVRSFTQVTEMFWLGLASASCGLLCTAASLWRNSHGQTTDVGFLPHRVRIVKVVLTVAHLNHVAGDDRDDNLKALCQWCHLNYDKLHHKETRPLLQEAV